MRARFTEPFQYTVFSGGAIQTQVVDAGNRIPGIPRADGYAELAWNTRDARTVAALEMRASDGMPTDDRNTDASPAYATFALRLQWRAARDGWHAFARVDNLFDRDYVGSVIVNEGNARWLRTGAGARVYGGHRWDCGG